MKKILALILCAGFVCMAAACQNSRDTGDTAETGNPEASTENSG